MKIVRHPTTVRLHEVLSIQTKMYVILEFVTGGELFDKIVRFTYVKTLIHVCTLILFSIYFLKCDHPSHSELFLSIFHKFPLYRFMLYLDVFLEFHGDICLIHIK
ncbi:putative non-specific serine/threonine protein kinase [Helianthus annuus]|nr:putative non-specific serine/threonine protein kinase [Helianthus annuus]